MNKIEELEATVKEALAEIEKLKNSEFKEQVGRADNRGNYYVIQYTSNSTAKTTDTRSSFDDVMYMLGNYYLTETSAQKELDRQIAYATITRAYIEQGNGVECDWKNENQAKHKISAHRNRLVLGTYYTSRNQPKALHTTSSKARDWVFTNLQDELKCWYEVE